MNLAAVNNVDFSGGVPAQTPGIGVNSLERQVLNAGRNSSFTDGGEVELRKIRRLTPQGVDCVDLKGVVSGAGVENLSVRLADNQLFPVIVASAIAHLVLRNAFDCSPAQDDLDFCLVV